MINYIVYNEDGKILRTGTSKTLLNKANENEYVIEGVADDSIHMIVDGQVVDKPIVSKTTDELLDEIRMQRDLLLLASDWTQVSDAPLTKAQKEKYKSYRQALRDLPSNYDTITSIEEVTFPNIEDF